MRRHGAVVYKCYGRMCLSFIFARVLILTRSLFAEFLSRTGHMRSHRPRVCRLTILIDYNLRSLSFGCILSTAIRYKDDGATAKKIPLVVEQPAHADAGSAEDDEESEDGGASSPRRSRKRRLLRKDGGGKLADPVLSTLSVNKNLG